MKSINFHIIISTKYPYFSRMGFALKFEHYASLKQIEVIF